MADEDVVWIPVLPSLRGFAQRLSQESSRAGRAAGRETGEAMASGLEQSRSAIESASKKLASARDKEADAAGKVRVAEAKLDEMRRQGKEGTAAFAAAEERLNSANRAAERAADARVQATNDLTQARARASNAANEGAESTRRFGSSLDGFTGQAGSATDGLKNFAVAAAGIGGAMALGMEAVDNIQIEATLAAQLGATGELAQEYGDTAGRLYRAGLGGSMEDAAAAVDAVSSSFTTAGFEGEASLDQISKSAMDFAKVFDTDITESVNTASILVQNGLAKDSTEAFDLMTASFQRVPTLMRGELPEILHEYSTHFRGLGFDGEGAFNMLVRAAEQGKFALDKTGDALKEFTLRGSDMSASSVSAYEAIGLSAEDMSRAISVGGEDAQNALQATAAGLLEMEDPLERANTAIALFGTPLEDLSVDQIPQFLEALTGGEDRIAGFEGAAAQMSSTLNDNAGVALESFKRTLTGGLTDALGSAAGFLMENKDIVVSLAVAVAPLAGTFLAITGAMKAWAIAQTLLNLAMNANPLMLIVTAIGLLVAGVIYAYRESETFRNIVQSAWQGIQNAVSVAWDSVIKPVFDFFVAAGKAVGDAAIWLWQNAIQPAWSGIQAAISAVWSVVSFIFDLWSAAVQIAGQVVMLLWQNYVQPAFEAIGNVISAVWSVTIAPIIDLFQAGFRAASDVVMWLWQNAIVPAWEGIKTAISAAWDFVSPILGKIGDGISALGSVASSVADGIRSAFSGIVEVLKAPIHAVGRLLSNVPEKILGVTIPGAGQIRSWGQTLQALRDGGQVAGRRQDGLLYGPGTGTSDSILGVDELGMPTALVSNKEFVVNAAATAENLPLLQRLNAGWVPPADFLHAMVGGVGSLVKDGDYTGRFFGQQEDSTAVAAVLGLRSLLRDGDYTGNLRDAFGVEEDSAAVDAALTTRDALRLVGGSFTGEGADVGPMDPHLMNAMINLGAGARGLWDRLPKLADGGLVSADEVIDFAQGVEGAEYDWGGVNWGDCSGTVSAITRKAVGLDPFGGRFATGNEGEALTDMGFQDGLGPAGSLNVGWFNGGPYGGHTALTLPNGVNVEMGGARGNGQYGGQAVGADDSMFTDHMHLPPEFFLGGDAGSPTYGETDLGYDVGAGAASAGSGAAASGGSSSSGAAASGGSAGSATATRLARPDEVARQIGGDMLAELGNEFVGMFGFGSVFSSPEIVGEDGRVAVEEEPTDVRIADDQVDQLIGPDSSLAAGKDKPPASGYDGPPIQIIIQADPNPHATAQLVMEKVMTHLGGRMDTAVGRFRG